MKSGVPGFEDVGDKALRVPVDQGKPGTLHLHHDLVSLAETMMAPMQVDGVIIDLARHHRLGPGEALE